MATVTEGLRAVGSISSYFNGTWRSGVASRPFPASISASGDRAPAPWVKTDSNQPPPRQLTAGSDLNVTAEGPWLWLQDAGLVIDFNQGAAWVPNTLRQIFNRNVAGNYGSISSLANWSFRSWAFSPNVPGATPTIGMLPGPISNPKRPMWNNLPAAQYRVLVVNPNYPPMTTQANIENQNAYSLSFNQAGVASLNPTGGTQGPVLV